MSALSFGSSAPRQHESGTGFPDRGWDSLCGQTPAGDDEGGGPVKSPPPQARTARAEGDHGLVPVLSARANRSTCRPSARGAGAAVRGTPGTTNTDPTQGHPRGC